MKSKFKINTSKIVKNGETTIPALDIEAEVEYNVGEVKELWELCKKVSSEAPEVADKFIQEISKVVMNTFEVSKDICIKHNDTEKELQNTLERKEEVND